MRKGKTVRKFELTNLIKYTDDGTGNKITLYRIRALRDIGTTVKAGDLGGWVEDERNLAQEGNSWISPTAVVCGWARIYSNAYIGPNSIVSDYAVVQDNVKIENSKILGRAVVRRDIFVEDSVISGDASVEGSGLVSGSNISHHATVNLETDSSIIKDSNIYDDSAVIGDVHVINSKVRGSARIYANANVEASTILGNSIITDKAHIIRSTISNHALIKDNTRIIKSYINDNAIISESASITKCEVFDEAKIGGNVKLENGIVVKGITVLSGDLKLDGNFENNRINCSGIGVIKYEDEIPYIDEPLYDYKFLKVYVRHYHPKKKKPETKSILFEFRKQFPRYGYAELYMSQEFCVDNKKYNPSVIIKTLQYAIEDKKYSFARINLETYDKKAHKLTEYLFFDEDIIKRLEDAGIIVLDFTKEVVDKIIEDNSTT